MPLHVVNSLIQILAPLRTCSFLKLPSRMQDNYPYLALDSWTDYQVRAEPATLCLEVRFQQITKDDEFLTNIEHSYSSS